MFKAKALAQGSSFALSHRLSTNMPVTTLNGVYTLTNNDNTLSVTILPYGAIIQKVVVPDRDGLKKDVVLGYDEAKYELENPFYFGAVVGRYANRIGAGTITLPSGTYHLAVNNGPNHLHGGLKGFDKRHWKPAILSQEPPTLRLELTSLDGEENYPGTLHASVTYKVTENAELEVEYEARVEGKETVVNLTNHTYFNLSGNLSSEDTIKTHGVRTLGINTFLELDGNNLPTGRILNTHDVPGMDLSTSQEINTGITQLEKRGLLGFDHPYIVYDPATTENFSIDTRSLPLREAIRVRSAISGITMAMSTTEPAFQFYTGNYVRNSPSKIEQGGEYKKHAGFCLESSRFPDAPSRKEWQHQVLLKEGEKYGSKTVYRFWVNKSLDAYPE